MFEQIARERRTLDDDLLVGIGDDAAVLRTSPARYTVVTTDMLFEDVHFRTAWTTPYALGWKAVAVNISDIAAMGGDPTFTFVAAALPSDATVDFVDELYRGMRDVCARYGAVIAGGDTNISPGRMVVNVTQLGQVKRKYVTTRSGAVPGDILLVTGELGNAAAGQSLLQAEGKQQAEEISAPAVAAHLMPEPRVFAGRAARRTRAVTAMIDVSDGLLGDLRKLCRSSQVGALVQENRIPVGESARQSMNHLDGDPLRCALYGGADYELLMTVSPGAVDDVLAAVGETDTPIRVIGEITAEETVYLVDADGQQQPVRRGWNRFLNAPPSDESANPDERAA